MSSWFPKWRPYKDSIDARPVGTNEYLPPAQSVVLGIQHAFAMFGATVLAPFLMGFDPNLAILMSGLCTVLFFFMTGGRVPSYLGSSFAFIGVVIAATGYAASGTGAPNANIAMAAGGIIACGVLYTIFGFIVMATGTRWIEKLMPPVVTGAVVMIIGLNLAPVTVKGVMGNNFNMWMSLVTVLCMGSIAVFTKGLLQRLLLLVGLLSAYFIYFIVSNVMGYGTPINFTPIQQAAWFGIPQFHSPEFNVNAMLIIAPIALILVAENLGHIKAVGAMTGENLDPHIGKAFVADGVATTLSGSVGGPGMTTYGENIGVMAVTRVYSTIIFVVAGIFAIFLGLSPKFGAIIHTIPSAILTGASIVVFGLITIAGAKIWIENKVDFSQNKNLMVAAVTIILGTGDFALQFGSFNLGGIGTATFAALILNWFFSLADKSK
ncbi:pyrimidine utilization transport protein G [Acinetobacter cumulans]|uniref:Pyrimidine utilization transport protein G n=1 Tax=Acinetobacter cumulans TaxID=2136182 RepID=A0A498D8X3_9GAMM|nr:MULTISPECIES: solute carrier family 23 protein [Acinetobacter]NWK74551.1 pyrimidine utilization transport protein G [Acinetobacter sp. SwsAc6]RFS29478.1 pyrimidine utilization transport protein G [Acinetobacter sp. SWAC5]RKG42796.1 pyrimidine utilization transport protein G [Acinetobacter cumulans]RKG48538.1 pyrimidine utilization transport protein G [Acinetobacter cumulans]RLL35809.1 pyrimidine utilization transport protein G [Acinetobacter cumulans]